MIRMLYEGKDNPSSPIQRHCIEDTLFKILTKILKARLMDIVDKQIPDIQFGFCKHRSTLKAVKYLQDNIQDALRAKKANCM